ncbi:MAG: asparagine synthase (glutamine-hydrolyzing) [Gemmatimonadetes bacterium]|nr:asparagine synthase (glutamine-hydrolyzing) [Gemmatimonadota bacterium]
MCGIVGSVHIDPRRPGNHELVHRMCDAITHRGPDAEGFHTGPQVGLGMRRLQVIDLETGAQPMSNETGTIQLVFNGEIYNYRELRTRLVNSGHQFKTQSDTEVIVHLYEECGDNFVEQLRGMFAIALWDTTQRTLILARDRLGKKPLFYAQTSAGISFASELTALMLDPAIDSELDHVAVDEYLTYLFVPHPRTPYLAVKKLPPATVATYQDGQLQQRRYWHVDYRSGEQDRRSEQDLVDELDEKLCEAVRLRLEADVPLGAFLSGGVDSSLIVAMMQKVGTGNVQTFTVGFGDPSFDEVSQASEFARYLGTQHTDFVSDYGVADLVPRMVSHFGEPFADSSAIPTFRVAEMTRQQVTVALSGDGGDEVFGGYRRYQARRWANMFNRLPGLLHRLLDAGGRRLHEPAMYFGHSRRKKLKRFLEYAATVRETPQTSWAFFFPDSTRRSLYSTGFAGALGADREQEGGSYAAYEQAAFDADGQGMLWFDLMTYLTDDILVKVDRMSMACSLEVRSPLLDHEVIEFMAGVSVHHKYDLRSTKRLLRRVAERYVPAEILQRPKHGFAVPLASWLKTDLKPWMQELLSSQAVASRGLFEPAEVTGMVDRHLRGERDLSQQLWALLMLEAWFRQGRVGR